LPQQFDDDAAAEYGCNHSGEIAEPRPVDQLPGGSRSVRMPIISENSTSAARALIRAFFKMNATSGAREASLGSAAGAVTSRAVKLFQLRPAQQAGGEEISTMIRIEKAATSLLFDGEIRRPQRLDQADQKPAQHRAGQRADAAEHRGGERLDARDEAMKKSTKP